jgi:hypothetical protein
MDKHKYPPNYYFSITNNGIGRLLMRWGEGASLLRNEWKSRETADKMDMGSEDGEDFEEESPGYCTSKAFTAPSPTATVRIDTPPTVFDTEKSSIGTSAQSAMTASSNGLDPIDALADSISSLALVPVAVQFGRGGVKGGFQHVSRGRGRGRGRGRVRRRGRGGRSGE